MVAASANNVAYDIPTIGVILIGVNNVAHSKPVNPHVWQIAKPILNPLKMAFPLLLILSVATERCACWEIEKFSADITVHSDAHITATEQLTVNFGSELWHGIFRTIPYAYTRPLKLPIVGELPSPYKLRIKVRSVTGASGRRLKYRISRRGRYVEIKIGDPKAFVSGVQNYVITYDAWRAITKFPTHAELYWNVTGNEWLVPIRMAVATVKLPNELSGLDEHSIRAAFYTGPYGSTEHAGKMQRAKDGIKFITTNLQPKCGLTIVIGMPIDVILFPSAIRELTWTLQDNWHITFALLAPLAALLCMLMVWYRAGRDPQRHMPIIVQYEPPKDLTPAEVGTLIDERADVADIVATVIDLAVRGFLKIREHKTSKFLFMVDRDYEFVLLKPLESISIREGRKWANKRRTGRGVRKVGGAIGTSDINETDDGVVGETDATQSNIDELERHEYLALKGIFKSGGRVLLSQLRNEFYSRLPSIRRELYRTLAKRKRLFYGDPDEMRNRFRAAAILIAAVGCGIFLPLRGFDIDPTSVFVALLGTGGAAFIVWLLAPLMPRKSTLGVDAVRHILGFKEFIMRVERDRLELMASEDPTLFDRILPYAIVLSVADEWAEKMSDIARQPPSWYEGEGYFVGRFNPAHFVRDIGRAAHAMGNTFVSTPGSAKGSGFRGGSSGGGFGGGGGGAW